MIQRSRLHNDEDRDQYRGGPPADLLADQAFTTRLTPFTGLPRRLPWFAVTRWRQRLANLLIFCAVPTALFWVWYAREGGGGIPAEYDLLRVAAPLCGSVTFFGPLAFQQGEFVYERLLQTIATDGADGGWNLRAIQQKIYELDRIYYRITIPLTIMVTAAVAYVFYEIRDIAPLEGAPSKAGALIILAFAGFTTATGIWGAIKVALIVHTTTNTAKPTWSAFRTEPQGIYELFRFAWSEGLIFSMGNVAVPALVIVMPRLSFAAKVIAVGFITLTFAGGVLLIGLTSHWLLAMTTRQHHKAVDRLAPTLERFADQVVKIDDMSGSEVRRLRNGLDVTLRLHQHIQNSSPGPISRRTILAAITTFIIPVLVTLLQVTLSKL